MKLFFSFFGGPTYGEGGGARWLGQKPKFFRKPILTAPLSHLVFGYQF